MTQDIEDIIEECIEIKIDKFVENTLLDHIRCHYMPDDVFNYEQLKLWAETNGFAEIE